MPRVREEMIKAGAGKEEDGWLVASERTPGLDLDSQSHRDFALRGRYAGDIAFHLRISDNSQYYDVTLGPFGGEFHFPGSPIVSKFNNLHLPTAHDFIITFRRQILNVWIDGKFASGVSDNLLTEGRLQILVGGGYGMVRDLAYADLPPEN